MKCIIVEDEPFALELIKGYALRTPFLTISDVFTNPFKALTFLMENEVDLIFLDINMPELSGLELLNSLPVAPMVIFTTAYSEFGAESYNYNAVDYLLKPITYGRFLKAVNKAVDLKGTKSEEKPTDLEFEDTAASTEQIFLKSGNKLHKVKVADIQYIEGAGNYMAFYFTGGKKILSLINMSELMELLPRDRFVRIHKSYVISLDHIDFIQRHQVSIQEKFIPIGLTYREHFLKKHQEK